ncbi:JmjC domain-containing protein [Micromonospora sp. WMMC273]|uniref:JmjC domain-containing protein n=1 Tax=Micromonospora sp. WMMC273 TaxID=3015157 RepID=UPI0022B73062|nr:cupin domain-containing protein [Micromonospora sp. WMMC273]MCZ7478859.1 hypothetical protein [Micromonospora sp. WMMC273]MCZ7478968.1 hypothetical protein [Micromonospora sp. WMMC273]
MSLRLLLPDHADRLLKDWPDDLVVFDDREPTEFDQAITAEWLMRYVRNGCLPVKEIAAVRDGLSLTQQAFLDGNGHVAGERLMNLLDAGFTLRLGNIQRIFPYFADLTRGIQSETGFSNYVHAFFTPGGKQGLNWHWDQQVALVVQISGTKRWELWRPIVDGPMREHLLSFKVWTPETLKECLNAGPHQVIDLEPGQAMWMPRGWIHNPHNVEDDMSVHLTFAIRERTPYWAVDEMVKDAIGVPGLRRVLAPETVLGPELAAAAGAARDELVAYLQGLDMDVLAGSLRERALRDKEFTI